MPLRRDPRFCRIHVDGPADSAELRDALADATGGAADDWGVEAAEATIDIKHSDDEDAALRTEFPGGFLFFPLTVEPLWRDEVDLEAAVEFVGTLLEAIWRQGWAAVAVCAYEERLPHKGGYGAAELPWPSA
jgi:hypothetical protein